MTDNLNSKPPVSMEDNIDNTLINEKIADSTINNIDLSSERYEILAERFSLSSFYIFGNIKTYESQFIHNKFNKMLFNNMSVFFFILLCSILYTIIFSLLSSNPVFPSLSEQIYYNVIGLFLFVSFISYVFYIRKKPNVILRNIYNLVSETITFFNEKQNRFDFIQYVQKNKDEFKLSEDADKFKMNLKNLKVSDKNNDVLNFTLIALFLYEIDIPNFYLASNSNYHFDVKDDNLRRLFAYLNARMKELIENSEKPSNDNDFQANTQTL